jgi:hypothetical protein
VRTDENFVRFALTWRTIPADFEVKSDFFIHVCIC